MAQRATLTVLFFSLLLAGVLSAAQPSGSLGLPKTGGVVAWGCSGDRLLSDQGQCRVPATAKDGVTAIAAYDYSLALTIDGSVIAWGCNGMVFQPIEARQCRVPATARHGITAIAAGFYHGLALTRTGT